MIAEKKMRMLLIPVAVVKCSKEVVIFSIAVVLPKVIWPPQNRALNSDKVAA